MAGKKTGVGAPLAPLLESFGACPDAVAWAKRRKIGAAAWNACPKGDWALWIAAHLDVDRSLVLLALVDVWRSEWAKYSTDPRPTAAIDLVERRAKGDKSVTDAMCYEAAGAARAAWAAGAAWAAWAAEAAGAAEAAWAAWAAWAAGAADTQFQAKAFDKRVSALVRKRIPWSAVKTALERNA